MQKERLVLYVGYLGHWVQLGIVPRRLEWFWRTWFDGGKEKEKRKKADRAGVMDLRAVQTKDEPGELLHHLSSVTVGGELTSNSRQQECLPRATDQACPSYRLQ